MRASNGQCLTCAPRAWDYPPRGSITASCGHKLYGDDTGEALASHSWDTFSDGSYGPCTMYACYCPWCALHLKVSGYLACDSAEGEAS